MDIKSWNECEEIIRDHKEDEHDEETQRYLEWAKSTFGC